MTRGWRTYSKCRYVVHPGQEKDNTQEHQGGSGMDLYSGGGVNLALLWFQPINDKPYIQIKLLITKEIAAGTELTHNSYKSNKKMSYTLLTNAEKTTTI